MPFSHKADETVINFKKTLQVDEELLKISCDFQKTITEVVFSETRLPAPLDNVNMLKKQESFPLSFNGSLLYKDKQN